MTSINGDPFGEVAMRRSIIGQVELRRSAAAEAAVSAAVRHRGVGRAAAERAPLPLALLAPPGRAGVAPRPPS